MKFRAFSDSTRLRILHLVRSGELCVGDIVKILRFAQPRVSRHLAYLRRAGLVRVRQDGQWKFYSLARPTGPFHQKLLESLTCCFGEVPAIQADELRAAQVRNAVLVVPVNDSIARGEARNCRESAFCGRPAR